MSIPLATQSVVWSCLLLLHWTLHQRLEWTWCHSPWDSIIALHGLNLHCFTGSTMIHSPWSVQWQQSLAYMLEVMLGPFMWASGLVLLTQQQSNKSARNETSSCLSYKLVIGCRTVGWTNDCFGSTLFEVELCAIMEICKSSHSLMTVLDGVTVIRAISISPQLAVTGIFASGELQMHLHISTGTAKCGRHSSI